VPGIGVVFNPQSGTNRRDPRALDRLARRLGDQGVVRAATSREALRRIAQEFQRLELDVIGICGGDGTNSMTLTGLLEVYGGAALPRIALLRGGTMNTVARAVGVRRGHPQALLERLCRVWRERTEDGLAQIERHVLQVRALDPSGLSPAAPGATSVRVGFLFGTGVVCGFLAEYHAAGSPRALAALTTLLRGVASAVVDGALLERIREPFRGGVEIEAGVRWPPRDYLAVAGGTIDQIGLGFRPFRRHDEAPGRFHLLGIHGPPLRLVRELPRIWRGAPLRSGCAEEAVTARAVLHPASGTLRYMIDGDLLACRGPLEVTVGPRIRIVVA
jgi:hypothetical protein